MKLLLQCFVLFSFSVSAQITITSSDFSNMFTLGNEITLKENDTGGSVNIGSPGGGNNWDFSWFTGNLTMEIESINPATAPHIAEFPGANIVTYSIGDYQGDLGEVWTYSSLNGSFDNHGAGIKLDSQPGDLFIIKHVPARIEAALPLTINSTWSQSYTQTIFYNGSPFLTSQVSQTVVADAYGTMTIPGGENFEAIRIRETMIVNGTMTSVSYLFLTKSGAQVSVYAVDQNPPTSGVIAAEGYSWNSGFTGSGGGIVIGSPDSTYIMIAGEQDSIKYENMTGAVNLYYSIDNAATFELIDSNYSSSEGIYYWNVPDSLLTTEARIKIVAVNDTNSMIFSDQFKIKPWQLTRFRDNIVNTEFQLFEPDPDGWSFCNCGNNVWPQTWWNQFNYQTGIDPFTNQNYPQSTPFDSANASDFPNWELFVDVFGVNAIYSQTNGVLNYRNSATARWGNSINTWGGSCFGFSVTSLLGYYHSVVLGAFIGTFNDLFTAPLNNDSRYAINYFQITQWGKEILDYRLERTSSTPRELLAEIKELFRQNNSDGKPLRFPNNNASGGHAVVPYKLERIDNSSNFKILVYDSNSPGSTSPFIYIDSVANTWSDSTSLNWGTGTSDVYLHNESIFFLGELTLRPGQTFKKFENESINGLDRLTIFNTINADVSITSQNGEQIGYQDSIAFKNMSDAVHLIPETGNFHPPIGYYLPENNYTIELDNFTSPKSNVLFDANLTKYGYRRYDADPAESDLIRFTDNGIKIINPDTDSRSIDLITIILEDSISEKTFITSDLGLQSNDSLNIREKDRSELLLNNYGTIKNYQLKIINLSENGQFVFENSSISMAQNSAHQIIPDWNDLQNQPVKILIDIGNDGTIDDSIFIHNQSTNIDDQGSLLSPNNYNLAQNYPNPFNPTTSIRYSIPERSNVTLKVYDILGNEVAILVNEEKDSGVYSVNFNASNLSSGVYFYKIQAGSYTSTKKMLLLK